MADEAKKPTDGDPAAAPAENTPAAETPADAKPKTIGEIQDEAVPAEAPKDTSKETVGLDKFLEIKKENKQLKKSLEDLEQSIKDGSSAKDVAADIDAIAEEYPDVDPKFLRKLANTITAQVKKEAEAEVDARLKPMQKKEKDQKLDEAFQKGFNAAMENMPEFKDIVNPSVIKTLSLDPSNRNKTFAQLIEDTYGNALTGKRTIDPTVPAGGKDPEPLDFAKARKDSAYFDVVMANPKLKAEYNKRMLEEGII